MLGWNKWEDHPANPLVKLPRGSRVVADPTVLSPEESPDGLWHMFTCSEFTLNHHVSTNGIEWRIRERRFWFGYTQFIFKEGDRYHLFYQRYSRLKGEIVVRSSKDLLMWTKPTKVLSPSLGWEKEGFPLGTVRNPCILKLPNGKYVLYYSGGLKFLRDAGLSEPRYVGAAIADEISGPFEKFPEPLLGPSERDRFRNLGAGGLRVYRLARRDLYVGFNNGIYADAEGRSRSAILVLTSKDGFRWKDEPYIPIIAPSEGWKKAFVYQLDVKPVGEGLWLYYNARDGWWRGLKG